MPSTMSKKGQSQKKPETVAADTDYRSPVKVFRVVFSLSEK